MSSSSKTKQKMNKNQKNTPNNGVKTKTTSSSSPSIDEEIHHEEVKSNTNETTEEIQHQEQENSINKNKKSKTKKKTGNDNGETETGIGIGNGGNSSCALPTARINRIIRSETADDVRFTHESIFLINKATENFLEVFSEDVYAKIAREKRKSVDYKYLASVVSKCKRYDFLSDFVPEKIKAEDALSERLA